MSPTATEATQAAAATDEITMRQGINRALTDAMEDDENVLLLGEDVADREGGGISGTTKGLSTRFGEGRVRSTPIAEQAITGAAIGAALNGKKPVAEIMMMNFATLAMDMIVNHAAKLRFMSGGQTGVPITLRMMTGGGLSTAGQHADYLEAWFAHVAGLKVVAPTTPEDAYGLLRTCIDDPDPCIFIENFLLLRGKGRAPERSHRVPIGKASLRREGTDLTIVAHSRMVVEALSAAAVLEKKGISAEVIDLRSIQPWDKQAVIASTAKTGRLLVVHEAVKPFGIGAEIAATVGHELFGKLKAPIFRMGSAFCAVPFSKPLETKFMPDAARIAEAATAMRARG